MLQDRAASQEGHDRFVRRVVEAGEVWGLKAPEGWAVSESQGMDDRSVMPFWSDRASAGRAAHDEWAPYEPTRIGLDDFLEHWLEGMAADEVLVGTNWDVYDCGLEISALELSRQLLAALAAKKSS